MVRSRRNSLVQSIASQPTALEEQIESALLDDSYLFEKLQKLSSVIDSKSDSNVSSLIIEEDSLPLDDKYEHYTDYLTRLSSNLDEYNQILDQTRQIDNQLKLSLSNFNDISHDTTQFINDTNRLYNSRKQLSKMSQVIPSYLSYFDNLDPIMRRLNHANSANIVRKESFKTILNNIDNSLLFLDEHSDLLDSEAYRIKFKQCLIRACDLISRYLTNTLKRIYTEIAQKDIMANKNTRDALIYNKFASVAEDFKPYVIELISRVTDDKYKRYHDELKSLLNDTFGQYFQIRFKLLNPIVWLQLDGTIVKDKNSSLFSFIQDNKTYFQQLCNKEFQIFMNFFPNEKLCKVKINHWLIKLCDPLYVTIGTKCMRETNIGALCDSLMMFEPFYEFEEDSEEYVKQFNDVQFDKVFKNVLDRLQNRLFDRVNGYIDENITKYSPTVDDFMISNRKLKLQSDEDFVKTYIENFKNKNINESQTEQTDSNLVSSYYVPLIKGLALLFKVYEMVDPVVFDQLAHHAVHSCLASLKNAYSIVIGKETAETTITFDFGVKLFYLRNLLLLRDEIQSFNIKYTLNRKSLDFSGLESFFKNYKTGETSLFSLAKDLVPKVANNTVDARSELVQELRDIIKDFTIKAGEYVLDDCLIKIESGSFTEINKTLRKNIDSRIPRIYDQICDSIDYEEVSNNLIEVIQQYCNEEYSDYYEKVSELVENEKLTRNDIDQLIPVEMFSELFTKLIRDLYEKHKL